MTEEAKRQEELKTVNTETTKNEVKSNKKKEECSFLGKQSSFGEKVKDVIENNKEETSKKSEKEDDKDTKNEEKKEDEEKKDEKKEDDKKAEESEVASKKLKDGILFEDSGVKLYFLYMKEKTWEERGIGELNIYTMKNGYKGISFLRQPIMKFSAIHVISPYKAHQLIKHQVKDNSWCWMAVDDKGEISDMYKEKKTLFFAQFSSEKKFDEFKEVYNKSKEINTRLFEEKQAKAAALVETKK